jgi:hypothetical protein
MKIKKIILSTLSGLVFVSFANTSLNKIKAPNVKTVTPKSVDSYLFIQKQLAADSLEGVSSAADQIYKDEKGDLSKESLHLSKSKNIEEARESFKKVSNLLIISTHEKDRKGAKIAYCPMAQAQWLQLGETIKNPYYGASMLECGRFESGKSSKK